MISFNDSQRFHFLNAICYGRRRQADSPSNFCGAQSGVFLKLFQNTPVQIIDHFMIAIFIHKKTLNQRFWLPKTMELKVNFFYFLLKFAMGDFLFFYENSYRNYSPGFFIFIP